MIIKVLFNVPFGTGEEQANVPRQITIDSNWIISVKRVSTSLLSTQKKKYKLKSPALVSYDRGKWTDLETEIESPIYSWRKFFPAQSNTNLFLVQFS